MKRSVIKYSIILFAYAAVLYPLWVRAQNLVWDFSIAMPLNLFPFFGLAAFSLLWLHSLSGVFEPWLGRYINFERFVRISSMLILVCIIAHPLLLLFGLNFRLKALFSYYDATYIWLAIFAWVLLITYDIGKLLKGYQFFTKHWNKILIISNIGFLMTFFHSLKLGSDLQGGPLRIIWIFYGVTAMLSILYTYGLKKLFSQSPR